MLLCRELLAPRMMQPAILLMLAQAVPAERERARMAYGIGIDVGTTYTAAAICR